MKKPKITRIAPYAWQIKFGYRQVLVSSWREAIDQVCSYWRLINMMEEDIS